MSILNRLWNDEAGAVLSAEIVLVATILVIGSIVGLKSVRDSVVAELADVAQAIGNISQTYSYSSVEGHFAGTDGSTFTDRLDFCDGDGSNLANAQQSKCVSLNVAPSTEAAP